MIDRLTRNTVISADLSDILNQIACCSKIEIEIGCGNGHFLTEYAADRINSHFVGIEQKKKRCLKTEKKAIRKSLTNIRLYHGRAQNLLEQLPLSSIDVYHIYFPDPWPKAKHRRRRFLQSSMTHLLYQTMKYHGFIHFATDILDYYLQAKILFHLHVGFEVTFHHVPEEIFLSVYGRRTRKSNRQIYYLSAKKQLADEQ